VGTFEDAQSITVGPEGDVYVYDNGGEGSVHKFNAAGEPQEFSSLKGSTHPDVIENVGHASFNAVDELAISPAGETKGDLYVASDASVGIYSSATGASLGELSGTGLPAGAPWSSACGVAVGPNGAVYVGLEGSSAVNRYVPSGSVTVNSDYMGSLWEVGHEPCNLAVDATESLYVTHYESGPVFEYPVSEFNTVEMPPLIGTEIDREGSTLATDSAIASHVYIDEQSDIAEYETSGLPRRLGTSGAAEPGELKASFGVAVVGKAGEESVYTSSASSNGVVNIYGPVEPRKAQIVAEFATEVTAKSVDLNAQVNPHGNDTHYYFQYGAESCAAQPSPCASSPEPPGSDIGTGESAQTGTLTVQNLQEGTTYHYRVVAVNRLGEVFGEDRTFTTRTPSAQAGLPDGRQYELVSPADKRGGEVLGVKGFSGGGMTEAAANGEAITYLTNQPPTASPAAYGNASQLLAARTGSNWTSQEISTPNNGPTRVSVGDGTEFLAFASDLSAGVVQPFGESPLPGDSPGALYLRADNGSYAPIVTLASLPAGIESLEHNGNNVMTFLDATPDARDVVIHSFAPLLTAAPAPESHGGLYEWNSSGLALVSVLPNGAAAPAQASLAAPRDFAPLMHDVSTDGSRIVWAANGGSGESLYDRNTATNETVELDESEVAPEGGGGLYETASGDGQRVFFAEQSRKLTANASGEDNLYVYDWTRPDGERLTDLTLDPGEPAGPRVREVIGASEDGTYIYFVAGGVLPEAGLDDSGKAPVAGHDNLYAAHFDGTRWNVTLIVTAPLGSLSAETGAVSRNGRFVALTSAAPLTSYDNTDAVSGQRDAEVYLYDARDGRITCPSCSPTGSRPVGEFDAGNLAMDPTGAWYKSWVAATLPAWTPYRGTANPVYQPHFLTDEGRLFFDSVAPLVPHDTNGREDVYEFEPSGVGSCVSTLGCVALISSGTGNGDSVLADASTNGNDVFFTTTSQLVPDDTDNARDLYDAHVCAPLAPCAPPPEAPAPVCASGDACRTSVPPQPTVFGPPPSATFTGPGNLTPPTPASPAKPKTPTKAQLLAKALKACHNKHNKHNKHKRLSCEKQAHKRYSSKSSKGHK